MTREDKNEIVEAIQTSLGSDIASLKTDMTSLKTEMASFKTEMISRFEIFDRRFGSLESAFYDYQIENDKAHAHTQTVINQVFQKMTILIDHEYCISALESN